jgi:signal transduction histidine kinase
LTEKAGPALSPALLDILGRLCGIPAEQQPEVFDRFFRGRNAPAFPGSGLGLAIVRATLDAVGGKVGFTSGEAGTRFDVRLPLA